MTVKLKFNREWHSKNKMPVKPTMDQRIAWHVAHDKYCGCRDIPAKMQMEIRKRKSKG